MKDKLEKTGHKKGYYRLKAALTIFVCSIGVAAAAAIPVGISYQVQAAEEKKEEETSNVTTVSSSDSESGDLEVPTGGDSAF